jgi:Macoilin family
VRKQAGSHGDPKELAAALSQAQEQQAQLELTLSSETKVKMDLFSALGGAKRQLQINESKRIFLQ